MKPFSALRMRNPAAATVTSNRWREYYPMGDLGWGYISVNEIDARATPGGADQCTGGTASASSASSFAFRAFDNNNSAFWATSGSSSPGTVNQWLEYQFPAPVSVKEWRHVGDAVGSGAANPEQILIQYYDGSTWITAYTSPVFTTANWTGGSPTQTFTIP